MRSRAFQCPLAVRFAYLSAPPPASAFARRASYSANNASYAITLPHCDFRYENTASLSLPLCERPPA